MKIDEREMVPEDELQEIFRPRRPDPTAFRAGVARRIAEREREAAERAEAERHRPLRSAVVRRAAALLGAESLAAGTAGKAAATKLLPVALALPVLLMAGALGTFFASARSLMRLGRDRTDWPDPTASVQPRRAPRMLGPARQRLKTIEGVGLLVVLAAGVLLGGRHAMDAVLLALLVSMAGLVFCAGELARAVGLARADVRQVCVRLLGSLAFWLAFCAAAVRMPDFDSELGSDWSLLVLCAGLIACAAPGAGMLRASLQAAAILLVLATPLFCVASPRALRARFDHYGPDLTTWGWPAAAAEVEALRKTGEAPPDLTPLREALDRMIRAGAGGPDPETWTALADMGVVDAARWRSLDNGGYLSSEVDALLRPKARLDGSEKLYRLTMLLAARDVTDEMRADLLAAVDRSWPGDRYDPIDDAYTCVRAYDALGREDLADARRDDVARILRACWVPDGIGVFRRVGGFSPDQKDPDHSNEDTTWRAVVLMDRLGVPDGVDLTMLHGYLRSAARPELGLLERSPRDRGFARAALLLLERRIGLPPRTLLERMLGERLLLASILFVGLCLLAIRQTRAAPG